MVHSLEEIQSDEIRLVEEEKKTLKAQKKNAFAKLKKLIVEYSLTKCDIK
tara:strand:- start:1524 stop:1673 length:150 start_codon:yes stop_codon:yes gene_type:complete